MMVSDNRYKHGCSIKGNETPEYISWHSIKTRCLNPNSDKYARWGGRGITICEKWKNSFQSFLNDMGKKPSPKHTIERKNNDGNYEPSNCYWATAAEQNRNRRTNVRLEYNGEVLIIADWVKRLNIPRTSFCKMINSGKTIADILQLITK